MENAIFITVEDGEDLIISFAFPLDEPDDVKSLILLRTPKYEFALDESERGVMVSHDDFPDDEDALLEQAAIAGDVVTITTSTRTYTVGIGGIDEKEIEAAKKVLKKMNFDGRFTLTID
jgi:hypothetical protein